MNSQRQSETVGAVSEESARLVREAVAAAAQSQLGLQQPRAYASAAGNAVRSKRKAAPVRVGMLWDSVTITKEHEGWEALGPGSGLCDRTGACGPLAACKAKDSDECSAAR
eukprot:3751001-Prymnesium_polylepis.3